MSVGTTALMPLDPAVSPEHANRILPIRADLLPAEVTAGRNARRIRMLLICAVVLVLVVTGAWYWFAVQARNQAEHDAINTEAKVTSVRNETRKQKYTDVRTAIETAGTLREDLKGALATDLPWATLLDQLRSTATGKKVTIVSVVGSLDEQTSTSSSTSPTVGSLTITGTAKDKKTIADFVEALPNIESHEVKPVTNAYLTSATQQTDGWAFSMTADITRDALCGQFTTKCTGGGY